jgi:hypothetical protein
MPLSSTKKCLSCSSLSVEEAKEQNCWAGQTCHSKRSYYRKQAEFNARRRQAYREQKRRVPPIKLVVPIETKPVAFLYLKKQSLRKDSPLVEIGASVWQDDRKIAEIEPVSCLGWNSYQVRTYVEKMLEQLKEQFGIVKFSQQLNSVNR